MDIIDKIILTKGQQKVTINLTLFKCINVVRESNLKKYNSLTCLQNQIT